MADTGADLLVRREADANAAVRSVGIVEKLRGKGHDDGDACLVIGAEERRAAGSDDVVANLARRDRERSPDPTRVRRRPGNE